MEQIKQIVKDIRSKNPAPLYFLMGEEAYYIDKISEFIEQNILTEEEKGFNQMVLYGRDVTMSDVVAHAKRFPLMAEKQVIIVKEAQELGKELDLLEGYCKQLQPSTVLVFCYKYKSLDKKRKIYKAIERVGVVFESKKLRDYQIESWIATHVKSKGFGIEPKASSMLAEFLGTDLAKIANEIDKLALVLPSSSVITPDIIEQNIGFSKDFNNFELQNAIIHKNQVKAYKIAHYFGQNPKSNPIVLTVGLLYAFFSKLLIYHGLVDKSSSNAVKQMKISPYAIKDYEVAYKKYPMKKVSAVVSDLKDIDLKSKGVGATAMPLQDLLKEMLVKIFN